MQQVKRELLIISDVELLHVELGEDVERGLRLDRGDAGNRVQRVVDVFALLVQTTAGHDVVVDALVAAESGLHDRLGGHIRADAHVGEHVDALDIVLRDGLVAAEHHPSDAVARDHVRLRQAGERDTEQVRGHGRYRDVLESIHHQTVVDLVGEDHQLVFAGQIDDLLQHLLRVEGAGRVVRVDQDDRHRAVGDLAAHVIDVRVPFGFLVAHVVHGGAAGQVDAGGPQRVVGAGHQNLVAVVEQGGQRQVDQLADAVAGVDVFDADIGQVLELRVLHDRLARREQALGRGVAFRVAELPGHVVYDLVRCAEAERRGVADVELEHVHAGLLHAGGLVDDRSAHVVQHVVKFGGFVEVAHGCSFRFV